MLANTMARSAFRLNSSAFATISVRTKQFLLPPLKARVNGRWMSITDHEPLLAELEIRSV